MAGLDIDHVTQAQQAAGYIFKATAGGVALGNGLALGFTESLGLRLAAAFCHGFSKVGEQNGEPEPESDLEIEAESHAMIHRVVNEERRSQHATDFHDKHDGILDHPARIQFAN